MTGLTYTYAYNAFGVTAATGTNPNHFRYTGREWDSETGLYYYRARYYDPTVGRFISSDPIGFHGGLNFYTYVGNSGTNLIDPTGLAPSWWTNLINGPTPPLPSPPKPPPMYNPGAWSGPYLHSNNCYSYACDRRHPPGPDWSKPQPGGADSSVFHGCGSVMSLAKLDGVLDAGSGGCCPVGYHKVKLYWSHWIQDYHWYRQDSDGGWSSKHGWYEVGPQVNPTQDASSTGYDQFCADMCAKNQ